MKHLDFVRADRRNSLNRKSQAAAATIESLEQRSLLSATVVSQIPTQNLTAGVAGAGVTLSTFLNDPALTGGTVIKMATPLGNIPLVLTDSQTPLTVTNFLQYITNGDYVPTIIQRSAPGFVLQGGGTKPDGSNNAPVGTLQSEAGISNTTGTIAMVLSTGPNSANNQWFINLADNSSVLDGSNDGGPFTVFGNVVDGGMSVATAISQLQIINGSAENSNWFIGQNDGLPVINYSGSTTPTTVPQANLVTDTISVLSAAQAAPTYSVVSNNTALVTAAVNNGVLTLTPVSPTASGTTTVTATVTDLNGETASSTFTVNISGLPTVSTTSTSGNAGAGNQIVFPITLSSAESAATTFNYALTPGTAPSSDFQATGSSVTIPAGSTQASIAVNVPTNSTGTAETFTLTLSGLSSGTEFPGGAATLAVTGTIQPVAAAGSTQTSVTASSPSVAFGGSDTIIATITPAVAGVVTGTVTFFVNSAAVGTATVSNNSASLVVDLNSAGNQGITATYNGDAIDGASSSGPVIVSVDAPSIVGVTVTKSTLPAAGIAGQPFKGSLTISMFNANLVVPQDGPLTLKVWATSGGLITPDSVLFASLTKNVIIKPGASANLSLPIKTLPVALAEGNYTLVAQVTDTAGLLTAPVNVSALAVTAPVIALTESFAKLVLPVSVVATSKTSAVAVLKITNNGNITSTGATPISLYASTDGTTAGATLINTLTRKLIIKPGKSITVSIPLRTYPSVDDGIYSIVAKAIDPLANVTSVASTQTVNIGAAKIDLVPSVLAVPATAKAGKTFTASLTIANNGNVVASSQQQIVFTTSASADGSNPAQLATVPARIKVQPGKSQVIHLKVPVPSGSSLGAQFVIATLETPLNTSGGGSAGTAITSPFVVTFS